MSKRTFAVSDSYHGLQEALEAIMGEDDDVDMDLVVLPPEPSMLTDEEEGDDDNIIANDVPGDIPGNVEVFIRRDEDEWDSSDEEPIVSKSAKRRRPNLIASRWRKCDPVYDPVPALSICNNNNIQKRREKLVADINNKNPVAIFEKFFDQEVMTMIVQYSKLYADQKNKHDFELTVEDLKTFLGILILSGYHTLPRERLYWSFDEDCHVNIVTEAMTRNRFLEIKRFLHFCDNAVAGETSDKMFKVRPLADILMKKFMQWEVFHTELSIDESMVKYFGRHPSKQFIRGKPVRFGYKNWMLASADGYCYSFDIYCGKSQVTGGASEEPLGTRVVKNLLNKLDTDPKDHIVFFDNFFTSFKLLHDLRESGYRATGTVREGRTNKCPLMPVKEMKKKDRAYFDYRFDTINKILFVRWLDNSVCTMGTNYDGVLPLGKVKRWNTLEKKKTDVDIPQVFVSYNKGMGGVDQADQSISLYRVSTRGKKWWWVLFTYMLDLAISNAWRLHGLCNDAKMDQLLFRRSIARHYLRQAVGRRVRPSGARVPSLQYDGQGHFPQKVPKQLRCNICHTKARWQCKKCVKTLCIEKPCFEIFHTQ